MTDIDQYLIKVLKRCEADNVHDLGAASQTLIFELAIEARTDLPRLARYCQKLREELSKPKWWAALTPSGKILEVQIGGDRPTMLPPCSNQDLPQWVGFLEADELLNLKPERNWNSAGI